MRTIEQIVAEYRDIARRSQSAPSDESNRLAQRECDLERELRDDHGTTLREVV